MLSVLLSNTSPIHSKSSTASQPLIPLADSSSLVLFKVFARPTVLSAGIGVMAVVSRSVSVSVALVDTGLVMLWLSTVWVSTEIRRLNRLGTDP